LAAQIRPLVTLPLIFDGQQFKVVEGTGFGRLFFQIEFFEGLALLQLLFVFFVEHLL
jgi:hypothetical protein